MFPIWQSSARLPPSRCDQPDGTVTSPIQCTTREQLDPGQSGYTVVPADEDTHSSAVDGCGGDCERPIAGHRYATFAPTATTIAFALITAGSRRVVIRIAN